jgi:hypothetical protein
MPISNRTSPAFPTTLSTARGRTFKRLVPSASTSSQPTRISSSMPRAPGTHPFLALVAHSSRGLLHSLATSTPRLGSAFLVSYVTTKPSRGWTSWETTFVVSTDWEVKPSIYIRAGTRHPAQPRCRPVGILSSQPRISDNTILDRSIRWHLYRCSTGPLQPRPPHLIPPRPIPAEAQAASQ